MEPITISKPSFFSLKYSTAIRIWHWLTFLFMTASIVTVLVASTLFEDEHEGPRDKVHQPPTEQKGQGHHFDPSKLSPEQRVTFTYRHQVWDVHKYIGFGLCFLLLSRVLIEATRNKEERLIKRIHKAVSIPVNGKDEQQDKKHFLLVKKAYLVFYILFFLMAITGLIMAFDHTAFLKPVVGSAHQIHSFVQYLIYAYILAHIVGVVRADMNKQKGMVSAMINGGE